MSETMIERVVERAASAILARVPEGYGMTRIEARDYARAAIKAMREPTPGMVAAFWRPVHDNGHGIFDGDHVFAAAWASAIDAALSTEEK